MSTVHQQKTTDYKFTRPPKNKHTFASKFKARKVFSGVAWIAQFVALVSFFQASFCVCVWNCSWNCSSLDTVRDIQGPITANHHPLLSTSKLCCFCGNRNQLNKRSLTGHNRSLLALAGPYSRCLLLKSRSRSRPVVSPAKSGFSSQKTEPGGTGAVRPMPQWNL